MDRSTATAIEQVTEYREAYADGSPRVVWSSGVANDGRMLLHGRETWYHPGGAKQHEVDYRLGVKTGRETYWAPDGTKQQQWVHRDDGTSDWTTWWPDGAKRSESTWKSHELVPGTDKFYARVGP